MSSSTIAQVIVKGSPVKFTVYGHGHPTGSNGVLEVLVDALKAFRHIHPDLLVAELHRRFASRVTSLDLNTSKLAGWVYEVTPEGVTVYRKRETKAKRQRIRNFTRMFTTTI